MKRAFFSFDVDEDQGLKHHMVGQMKLPSSPFTGADWSMKEAAPQKNWEQVAESLSVPNGYSLPPVLAEGSALGTFELGKLSISASRTCLLSFSTCRKYASS